VHGHEILPSLSQKRPRSDLGASRKGERAEAGDADES
jgi:hypothetical protein